MQKYGKKWLDKFRNNKAKKNKNKKFFFENNMIQIDKKQ